MPEVGGGPSTSIFSAGSDGSISFQHLVGVGDELAVGARNLLGERQEDLGLGQLQVGTGLGVGEGQAVEADLQLDDFGDAVLGAILELALLDGARGVGNVGVVFADAGAEQLEAAAGAGQFDDRGLEAAGLAELLGDGGGERIDRRGADDRGSGRVHRPRRRARSRRARRPRRRKESWFSPDVSLSWDCRIGTVGWEHDGARCTGDPSCLG